jgi:RNA polymerase sigma factor (sigma-70 family)
MISKYLNEIEDNNDIKRFFTNYESKLNEPIIKNFLHKDDNLYLLFENIKNPSCRNRREIDERFKKHYNDIKVKSYINSLIYFYSIDYDKKVRKIRNRYVPLLDQEIKTSSSETSHSHKDFLLKFEEDYIESYCTKSNDILENIENEKLFNSLKLLTEKQRYILSLIYIKDFSNKDVAELLNESQQNISNIHRSALKKLKTSFIGGEDYEC